jgi:Lon protease-like protein
MAYPLTLTSLPLFPLEAVLFPEGTLSLRVFEVRYLDMVRKCHHAGAPFGVVALTSGHEVRRAGAPRDQFSAIGTLAVIEELESPQPGLLTVVCKGVQRFRVQQSAQLPHGLWVADVEQIEADPLVPIPEDLRNIASSLTQVLSTLHQRSPDTLVTPTPSAEQLNDCGWVANRWCELLPIPVKLKQQLMELENPLVRLELVGDVLDRAGIAPH